MYKYIRIIFVTGRIILNAFKQSICILSREWYYWNEFERIVDESIKERKNKADENINNRY